MVAVELLWNQQVAALGIERAAAFPNRYPKSVFTICRTMKIHKQKPALKHSLAEIH
jgi:hypothetical protein